MKAAPSSGLRDGHVAAAPDGLRCMAAAEVVQVAGSRF
jgi:hypothetical protein